MHYTIFSFNDETASQKDTRYTEDQIYKMMAEQRKLDGVKEITYMNDLAGLMKFFVVNGYIHERQLEVKPDGIVIHMDYDTLIDAMYQACDDLGEYWFMNDGYEMVTMKDYFRILLQNHMGEDSFDMKLVQAWDYHY